MTFSNTFIPKTVTVLKEGYNLNLFFKDFFAGLIVAVLALPMSIAFAIASGARPEQGIVTAIVAGTLGSLFSGSRYQITGPTGAFVVLIQSIITTYGYQGLVTATLFAGLILLGMGFFRFGNAMRFIPYPVIVGFTSGIAVIIFSSQIYDFLGLGSKEPLPAECFQKWVYYFKNMASFNSYALLLGFLTLGIIIYWPRITKVIPGPLVAILGATLLSYFFNLPVETIGQRFGEIKPEFPMPTLPTIAFCDLETLIGPAIAIALLAGIESLLAASVADGMTGRRHRSDMELISQGIANLGSALFQGLPATGAIARTATNIKSGGATPFAGIIHAIALAILIFVFGRYISYIPMTGLAALLIFVAYNMSEWRTFRDLIKSKTSDSLVLLITFALTVFVDLVTAIEAGVILASLIFINKMAKETGAKDLKQGLKDEDNVRDIALIKELNVPDEIDIFEIYGPLFFAACDTFRTALSRIGDIPKILILRMRYVKHIDTSGLQTLKSVIEESKAQGTRVILSGIDPKMAELFEKVGLTDLVGKDNIKKDIVEAVRYAKAVL